MITFSTISEPKNISVTGCELEASTHTFLEFFCHYHLRGLCDVVRCTHRWICWRDNWHSMCAVGRIKLRGIELVTEHNLSPSLYLGVPYAYR